MKEGVDKTFTVVDAAMNDLIRPTLYEAQHEIWPVERGADGDAADRAGCGRPGLRDRATIWRSTGRCRRCGPGDLVALMTAGAYGAAMSSTYNTRLLVPEVLVKGGEFAIVRPRQSYEALIGLDRMPGWLEH